MRSLYNEAAEENVIGSCILRYEAALEAADLVRPEDFYVPFNARAFAAVGTLVERGMTPDIITVAAEMGGDVAVISKLSGYSINVPSAIRVKEYARIIADRSAARGLFHRLTEAQGALADGADPYDEAASLERGIATMGSAYGDTPEAMTLFELRDRADAAVPVVIPGMLNQDWRTIVVAGEGAGKSTLIRTIGVSASQGYHPFTHVDIPPVRVLLVDLENPREAILETGLKLLQTLQVYRPDKFDVERLKIWRKPGGIDIRRLSDRAELQREIAAHQPDLVCIGPVYKMYRRKGNESYEDSADDAMAVLDDLRVKYKFALLLEHHAAKGKPGEKREMAPMGSQRWMAWPEGGISLEVEKHDPTVVNVKRFRGDRLSGIEWPDVITRDPQWIFTGTWTNGIPQHLRSQR